MKISIVTPSFNQARYLKACADSILSQKNVDLQWVVVDGGSTDGSIDFLRGITDGRLRYSSQKDNGQSDAINKGLARSSGEIIGWLNSDDAYAPGALAEVMGAFERHPDVGWLVGRCEIIDERDKAIRKWITHYKNRKLAHYTYRHLLMENFISQPAVFFRKSFVERVGPLDEALHYTMDYDLWLRMGRIQDPIFLPRTLSFFRVHGSSKTVREKRRQFEEDYRVACRYIGDSRSLRWRKRYHIEKIVWTYRLMRVFRR